MKNIPWFLLLISITVLSYFTFTFSEMGTFALWGEKTTSIFDIWSIQHVLSGIVLGYFVLKLLKVEYSFWTYTYYILAFSILWESLELFFEVTSFKIGILHWNQGVEYWANRLITDPLLVLTGGFLYKNNNKILPISAALVVLFLLVNLFISETTTLQAVIPTVL